MIEIWLLKDIIFFSRFTLTYSSFELREVYFQHLDFNRFSWCLAQVWLVLLFIISLCFASHETVLHWRFHILTALFPAPTIARLPSSSAGWGWTCTRAMATGQSASRWRRNKVPRCCRITSCGRPWDRMTWVAWDLGKTATGFCFACYVAIF